MSATQILYDERDTALSDAQSEGKHLWLTAAGLEQATGWKLEDRGLCKGDACVPTNAAWISSNGQVDLAAFAEHMGQPALHAAGRDIWAFGESVNARRDQMFSLEAPDFELPDIDGNMHKLSDYRGKKVFLYSWGSY